MKTRCSYFTPCFTASAIIAVPVLGANLSVMWGAAEGSAGSDWIGVHMTLRDFSREASLPSANIGVGAY